jgi:DNA replication protein DnaC
MKKGAYQQLNLTHLAAALPQVLQAAQREQWTYETFLQRALAAELEGREQKAMARRLKAARIPCTKTLDGFDFSFQPTRIASAGCENWGISRLCGHAPLVCSLVLQEPGKRI